MEDIKFDWIIGNLRNKNNKIILFKTRADAETIKEILGISGEILQVMSSFKFSPTENARLNKQLQEKDSATSDEVLD